MSKKKTFRWRGLVTLFLLTVFMVDAASGIILYISPAGRIAHWSNWAFWGLNKSQWESVHIVFSLVLLLILAGHLYFNWRMLSHFVWDKMRQVVNLKKELAGALVITILLLTGTLWSVQPISAITDLRENFKRSDKATGFVAGREKEYGGRSVNKEHQDRMPESIGQDYFRNETSNQRQFFGRGKRGGGFGRNEYAKRFESKSLYNDVSQLKGRDYVRLGKLETHIGLLVKLKDEWGLKVDDRTFEIHMGPAEYHAYKGFALHEGAEAKVTGFVYETNLSVTTIESGGQIIHLRDEAGRPMWSGSIFIHGRSSKGSSTMSGSNLEPKGRI